MVRSILDIRKIYMSYNETITERNLMKNKETTITVDEETIETKTIQVNWPKVRRNAALLACAAAAGGLVVWAMSNSSDDGETTKTETTE